MLSKTGIFALALAATILCGCYESVDVTWIEAGVYKGARDPLVERLNGGELDRLLAERINQVQTDR